MNEIAKTKLRVIVRMIPGNEVRQFSINGLWKRYAYDYEYNTFRKYLRALRGSELS